ncbi:hypothetical protein OG21DRAFT_1606654 [Imleria badia]|nr:hypothetical protein OG21DRAFT_1606654 [Imleria badia]
MPTDTDYGLWMKDCYRFPRAMGVQVDGIASHDDIPSGGHAGAASARRTLAWILRQANGTITDEENNDVDTEKQKAGQSSTLKFGESSSYGPKGKSTRDRHANGPPKTRRQGDKNAMQRQTRNDSKTFSQPERRDISRVLFREILRPSAFKRMYGRWPHNVPYLPVIDGHPGEEDINTEAVLH